MIRRLALLLLALAMPAGTASAVCPSLTNYSVSTPDAAGHPNDTVVTDNDTGLIWKQCAEGLSSSDPATPGKVCDQGAISGLTQPGALAAALASTYAGQTDWRLPNMIEMQSLSDYGCYDPAINRTFFPNTGSRDYWTSTSGVTNLQIGWFSYSLNGQQLNKGKTNASAVRLVRGGTGLDAYASNVPVVAMVSPDAGPAAGGTVAGGPGGTVTLTGLLFAGASKVTFDATDAAMFTVVNATTIAVAPPAHAPGTVDVRVTNANGTSEPGAASRYTYIAAPMVESVSPNAGVVAGGTAVVIAGTGFSSGAVVRFGDQPATNVVVESATRITATTPAHAEGVVDVTVTAAGGTSAAGDLDKFTYFTPSLVVDSLADGVPAVPVNCATGRSGTCRLRDAMDAARSGDTIGFAVDGTIVLAGATLVLDRDLRLDAGGRSVAVDGNGSATVLKVESGATARIDHLTIRGGNANLPCSDGPRCGGGVHNRGDLTLSGVTLTLNAAESAGAGIFSEGALRLVNSTVSGNTGGGIHSAGTAQLVNITIADGLRNAGGNTDMMLVNTIVTGACMGGSVDLGGNLDSDGSCGFSTANGSASAATVPLGPLQNNGGATPTRLPSPGSAAIGFGRDDACADSSGTNGVDQRGHARPQGVHCDAGAAEVSLHTLAVNVTTPHGTASSADGFIANCTSDGGNCSADYPAEGEGTPLVATLLATADAHYHFTGWGGDCAAGGTVTMDADRACTAAFAIDTHTVGGSVTGLAGNGLEVRLNGGDAQSVAAATPAFAFAPLPDLSAWAVTVAAQPVEPWQTCVADAATASGTFDGADVTNVAVHCTTNAYTVGGTVDGFSNTGSNLVLHLSAGGMQDLTLAPGQASFAFAFTMPVASGTAYTVSIGQQPQGQACTITAGASGTVRGESITDVHVACLLLPHITTAVSDGSGYAPYGSVTDYVISLSNTGGAAENIAVTATLSPAFDAANAAWACVPEVPGVRCAPSGTGPLSDTVSLPPDSRLTFLLSAPLRWVTPETAATVVVTATGTEPVTDVDTLVIFRDGFDGR